MTADKLNTAQSRAGFRAQNGRYLADSSRARVRGLLATLACLGAALVGQWLLDQRALRWESFSVLRGVGQLWLSLAGATLYALAAVLWGLRIRRVALEAPVASAPVDPAASPISSRFSPALVAVALLLGALAFPRFSGNQFSRDGTAFWLVGLAVLALAAWLASARPKARSIFMPGAALADLQGVHLSWYQVGLVLAMAVGAFYRFYRINVIPLEMGPDLAHNYNNIRQILMGEYPIFFPSHPGREALFFYLAAPFCRLFGLNHTNIKVAASLVGLATLPIVYLLGKEIYDREVGLCAAFFLGISRWHIALGRMGYRATLVPLMVALTWYLLVRGFKTGSCWFYALCGLFLGLGMYTYNAFMAAPLVVLGGILVQFLVGNGRRVLAHGAQVLLLLVVALYVFIPLGRYAVESPGEYLYRAATRVTSLEQALPANLAPVLLSNVARALGMFNVQGDGVFVVNVPFARQLGYLAATLFVLGLVHVLSRWRVGQNATVPIVGMGMLLPSAMALAFPHEVPNAIRAVGVLPAATLLSGVALVALRRQVAALLPARPSQPATPLAPAGLALSPADSSASMSGASMQEQDPAGVWRGRLRRPLRVLLIVVAAAALAIETWAVYPFYFRDYVRHLPDRNYSISLQMARAIDAFADDGQSFIKVAPYWYDGNAVRAQLRRADPYWSNELDTLDPNKPPLAGPAGRYMVLVHPDDQASLQLLRQAFPRGIALVNLDNTGAIAFITFYGER